MIHSYLSLRQQRLLHTRECAELHDMSLLAGKMEESPYYWFNRVMAAPNREARRRVLAEVPEHLRELVEYTVRDCFDRLKVRKSADQR